MESVKKCFWFVLFLFGLFAESSGTEEGEKITFKRFGGESDKSDHKYKCTFLGDAGVGKTHILKRFLQNIFDESIVSNFSAAYCGALNYKMTESSLKEEKIIEYVFWDTAGGENYRALNITLFSKDTNIIFFVYDVSRKETFDSIGSYWLKEVRENGSKDAKYVLVENKIDLEKERQVSIEEAGDFAKKYNMDFIEVSAKTGKGIFYKKENIPLDNEEEISTVTAFDEHSLEYILVKVTKELIESNPEKFKDNDTNNNTNNKVDPKKKNDPKKTDDSKDTGLCSCCCKECF